MLKRDRCKFFFSPAVRQIQTPPVELETLEDNTSGGGGGGGNRPFRTGELDL